MIYNNSNSIRNTLKILPVCPTIYYQNRTPGPKSHILVRNGQPGYTTRTPGPFLNLVKHLADPHFKAKAAFKSSVESFKQTLCNLDNKKEISFDIREETYCKKLVDSDIKKIKISSVTFKGIAW